jgi:hypothetical protein
MSFGYQLSYLPYSAQRCTWSGIVLIAQRVAVLETCQELSPLASQLITECHQGRQNIYITISLFVCFVYRCSSAPLLVKQRYMCAGCAQILPLSHTFPTGIPTLIRILTHAPASLVL